MDRRCIICGLEPGEKCVYPRNMAEARRWQNLAKLGNFDVDTESLCKHGCVCTLHLDTDQDYGPDPPATPDAVCSQRSAGGKISPFTEWCCLEKGWLESAAPPNNNNTNDRKQMKSKQNRDSMSQKSSKGYRCNIGLHRCRAAQIQGNLFSEMRKSCYRQQSTGSTKGTAAERNLKACQPTASELCACINYPILRDSNAVSEKSCCPLMRNPSPAPAPCTCECSCQRSSKNTRNHSQQRPRSCDRPPSFPCNQQQFLSSNDYTISLSSSTGQSSSTKSESHQEMMPEVTGKCTFNCSRQRSSRQTQNHSQQRPRSCNRLPYFGCNKQQFQSSNDRSLKASQSTVPVPCARLNYPTDFNAVSEKSCCPLMRNPSPAPAPCTCKCSCQRLPKNTQNHSQQRSRSCDRPPAFPCNQQQFQSSNDYTISLSSSTGQSSSTKSESHQEMMPKVKGKCTCPLCCQRSPKNTQNHNQQRPRPCSRLPCFACIQQQFLNSDDFSSSLGSSTDPCRSTTSKSHKDMMLEVKDEYCQTRINQLKDQEVQCSQHNLHPDDSGTEPKDISILAGCQCNRSASIVTRGRGSSKSFSCAEPKDISILAGCQCNRSASIATRGRGSSKSFSCAANIEMPNFEYTHIEMPNFEYAGEQQQQYSVNAVNVLLMNGSRQKPYEGPNPEICVQESDLADCNERAVFPEVDKPTYRVCRAATSGPNTKGQQDEANVLVLVEGPMDGCIPEDNSHPAQSLSSKQQFVEGKKSNQSQISRCIDRGSQPGQFGDNWINEPCVSNYTKLLELQKARINELDNLLQQHNKLQQTIQARMEELQCQENPAEKANKK